MKTFLFVLFFLLTSCFPCTSSVTAYAEEEHEFDDTIEEIIHEIDLSEIENLFDSLELTNIASFRELLEKVLSGDFKPDLPTLLRVLVNTCFGDVKGDVADCILIVICLLCLGILQNLTSGFSQNAIKKIIYFACYGVIVGILTLLFAEVVTITNQLVSVCVRVSETVFPILSSLIAIIGAANAYAVYQPIVLFFIQLITIVISGIVIPLFYGSFVFAIVGNLSDELKLDQFSALCKKTGSWITGILFGAFITYTTAQGITGAGFDSLASKSAKYALNSYVPIIGNSLKEGFDLLVAGCIVVKNSIGLVSIVLILLFFLSPIIKISITSILLHLTAAVTEPFADKKITKMITGVSSCLTLSIVICMCLAFSMIILIMLIILTCNRGII